MNFKKIFIFSFVITALVGALFLFFESSNFYLDKVNVRILTNAHESFTSAEVEVLQPFNAWFLKFKEHGQGKIDSVEVRFKKLDGWSDWQPLEIDKRENDDLLAGFAFIDQLVQHYQFRISISGETGYQVSDFQIETQDTTSINPVSGAKNKLVPLAQASLSDIGIVSRSAWGANPDYLLKRETTSTDNGQTGSAWEKRISACDQLQIDHPEEFHHDGRKIAMDNSGKELQWPQTFSKEIKKIIIHHTYTDEGKDLNSANITLASVEALIRAIYYYHAVFRGWGDIGYHYLVDPLGNVYEGRNGGEKVVGAHAYCANTGTIGISFIGDYTSKLPSKAALEAGAKLLGELSNTYNLKLSDFSTWHGKTTRNLVGHRDYAATACPGNSLYAYLADLAQRADQYAANNQISEVDYAYSLLQSDTEVTLKPLEERQLNFQIRNSGKLAFPAGSEFQVAAADIENNKAGVVIAEESVAVARLANTLSSGDTTTLTIPVAARMQTGSYRFNITPMIAGQALQQFTIVVKVAAVLANYEFVSAKHPPQPFIPSQKAVAWITLKNTSNFTWKKSGTNRIYLGVLPIKNETEAFTSETEIATLDTDIAPGQIARFVMNLEAPSKPGRYLLKFAPAVTGFSYLPDYGMQFNITVRELRFAAIVLGKTSGSDLQLDPGDTGEFFVKLKNISQFAWSPEQFSLELIQNSGVSIKSEALRLDTTVAENAETTISFPVVAANKAGKFRFVLQPRWSDTKVKTDNPIDFLVEINQPRLSADLQTDKLNLSLNQDESEQITVAYLNTGNVTWHQREVVLQRLPASASSFFGANWLSPLQPSLLAEASVKPGEVGHFTFDIKKNTAAISETENFVPIMKGLGRIRGKAAVITLQKQNTNLTTNTETSVSNAVTPAVSALSASILSAPSETHRDGPQIRIRLSFASDAIDVGGGNFQIQKDNKTLFTGSFADFKKSKMQEGEYFRVIPLENTVLEIPNWQRNANTKFNYNKFRGILEIRRNGETLTVINELPLEIYLHGIAEPSPKDPEAKQWAMTLLTRSYAYYYTLKTHRKFPSQPYDGSDSPAEFQQYLGYNYEILSNFPKWVDQTRGQVLTYQDQVVKTPYFTSSSGKTRTPTEAGWKANDFAFVKSVEDPWSCGMTSVALGSVYSCPENARGHGVGLSGNGAAGLAREGKTYLEIINYFYQGLEVKKVY